MCLAELYQNFTGCTISFFGDTSKSLDLFFKAMKVGGGGLGDKILVSICLSTLLTDMRNPYIVSFVVVILSLLITGVVTY